MSDECSSGAMRVVQEAQSIPGVFSVWELAGCQSELQDPSCIFGGNMCEVYSAPYGIKCTLWRGSLFLGQVDNLLRALVVRRIVDLGPKVTCPSGRVGENSQPGSPAHTGPHHHHHKHLPPLIV